MEKFIYEMQISVHTSTSTSSTVTCADGLVAPGLVYFRVDENICDERSLLCRRLSPSLKHAQYFTYLFALQVSRIGYCVGSQKNPYVCVKRKLKRIYK